MRIPQDAIAFGAFGLLGIGLALFQLRSGKSLKWMFGKQISRDHLPAFYWANVQGAALAGLFGVTLAVWMVMGANPAPVDPSVPVVQGEDLVVHGGGSTR